MMPKTRLSILLIVLAASSALVAFGDGIGTPVASEVVEPVPEKVALTHSRPQRSPQPIKRDVDDIHETIMIGEIQPRAAAPEMAKAFAVRDWTPRPPPAPPAPPPTAPPLPFTFLGKKLEDGKWQVFLGQHDKTHIAREGDSINGLYRVDSIRPPVMTFTYLPLQQPQTLAVGDTL